MLDRPHRRTYDRARRLDRTYLPPKACDRRSSRRLSGRDLPPSATGAAEALSTAARRAHAQGSTAYRGQPTTLPCSVRAKSIRSAPSKAWWRPERGRKRVARLRRFQRAPRDRGERHRVDARVADRPQSKAREEQDVTVPKQMSWPATTFEFQLPAQNDDQRVAPFSGIVRHVTSGRDVHFSNSEARIARVFEKRFRKWICLSDHARDSGSPKAANNSGLTKLVISLIESPSKRNTSMARGRYTSSPGARR